MSPQTVLDLIQEAFRIGLALSMPMMMVTLTVGVMVSVIQSITSIQEQTMSFVPKIIAVFLTVIIAFSWMLHTITDYTIELFQSIPSLIR